MGIRVGALVAPVGLGATIVAASANVFAQSGFGSPNDQFRYVYKNTVDNEFSVVLIAKILNTIVDDSLRCWV